MPLTLANNGIIYNIKKVSGSQQTRQFLENLGFLPETEIKIISKLAGNLIVQVKESRVAISKEMANNILVA